MTLFDARTLSTGWLSVALAAANDQERPALYRTVCVELFPTGVRLVSVDGFIALHSWVPNAAHSDEPEPDWDEAPATTAIAIDVHGRGRGLLGHLLKLARAKDAVPFDVRLTIGLLPEEEGQTLEGMAPRWVMLDHPDHERVTLPVYEGEFPNWRKVLAGFEPHETDAVALNPEIVGRLAKLGKLHGGVGTPLVWRFGGRDRMALLEVGHGEPSVAGAAMPVRWDFDRDAPEPTSDES